MSISIDPSSASARVFETALGDFKFFVEAMGRNYAPRVESNIELMLLLAFDIVGTLNGDAQGRPLYAISPTNVPATPPTAPLMVTPQYRWDVYRIDFRIDLQNAIHPFFVECDGHDFHERTKEQAERDRAKDRMIQEAGIPILRFTGREIYRDPIDCVNQVSKFIMNRPGKK